MITIIIFWDELVSGVILNNLYQYANEAIVCFLFSNFFFSTHAMQVNIAGTINIRRINVEESIKYIELLYRCDMLLV